MNPNTHTSELLLELDSAEEKIALMLELGASTAEKLLDFKNVDTESVGSFSERFLKLTEEVHACLDSKAHMIKDYKHYDRSSYSATQEEDLLQRKVALLQKELSSLGTTSTSTAATVHDNGMDDL
eukprot:11384-Heterococcus_DN1.PRE.2